MAALKLKTISIRNWGTIRSAELTFPPSGLVYVMGSTQEVSGGKGESVGAGKTLIGEAISRTLTGVAGRFTALGHFSHDDVGKDTYVRLETTLRDKPLTVEAGYKCSELSKTGEDLKFTYDGQVTWRSQIKLTRDELAKTIGVTPELAGWAIFIDGDKLDFSSLSQRSAVDLLMASLATPPWHQYYEIAKRASDRFKLDHQKAVIQHDETLRAVTTAEESIEEAEQDLAAERQSLAAKQAAHLPKLEAAKQNLAAKKEAHGQLAVRLKAIRVEMRRLEADSAEKYHAIEVKRQMVGKKITRATTFKNGRQDKLTRLKTDLSLAKAELADLKSAKVCSKCQRPLEGKVNPTAVAEQEAEITRFNRLIEKFARLQEQAADDLAGYRQQRSQLDGEAATIGVREKVDQLSREAEQLEQQQIRSSREISVLEATLNGLERGPDDSAVLQAETVLKERQAQLANSHERVKTTTANVAETKEALVVSEYWVEAYGPTGIPNMILNDAVAPLNEISRKISNLMNGGTLNVAYSTQRQLASGDTRSQLNIKVDNSLGAKRLEGSSKGEAGTTNVIVAETLAEVGQVANRVGYRWYDEVTTNFDPVERRSFFQYLKDTAHRLGILIFLVDHHQEAASYADHTLLVTKSANKTTTVSWL